MPTGVPEKKPDPICRMCIDPARRTRRFSLVVTIKQPVKPRHTTRGAGATDLCERCWAILVRGSRRKNLAQA